MSSSDVANASPFELNNRGTTARRSREVGETRTSRGRTTRKAAKARRATIARGNIAPTEERLAKPDAPVLTAAGHYLAKDGLEEIRTLSRADKAETMLARMHVRGSLDHDASTNERMFEAGKRYEELAYVAGLTGVAAQNLLSASGGDGNPAYATPTSERAARARAKVRQAWTIMGTKVGTAVHGIIVDGKDAESVGRTTSGYRSASECRTAGMTTLRIGLWMLVNARWA